MPPSNTCRQARPRWGRRRGRLGHDFRAPRCVAGQNSAVDDRARRWWRHDGSGQLYERAIPPLPWTLRWLTDQPVSPTALPDDGDVFAGWQGIDGHTNTVWFVPGADVEVRAVFVADR